MTDSRLISRSLVKEMNGHQRSLLAQFLSNISIVLLGFSLTDQPFVSNPMAWELRWSIIGAGLGFLSMGLRLEWSGRRSR